MKNKVVIEILHALQRMDGYTNEAGAFVPYQIDGAAANAIVINLNRATRVNESMDATRIRILKGLLLPEEKNLAQTDPRFPVFVEELDKALDQEADFKPYPFKRSGLKLDVNTRMSRNDLAKIFPLYNDEDTAPVPPVGAGGVPAAE